MLAWRGFPRCWASLSSRHFSRHLSRRLLTQNTAYHIPAFSARPNTLSAKLWYRKDGTPRSKWKGVAYTSVLGLVGSLTFGVYAMTFIIADLAEQNDSLSVFIRFVQSEEKISSADLSTLQGSVSCFREIFSAFEKIPKQSSERYLDQFSGLLNSADCPAEKQQRVHNVLREICERVRSGLRESRDREKLVADVAGDVIDFVIDRFLELHEYLTVTGGKEEMVEIVHYMTKGRTELPDSYEEVG